MSEFNDEAGMGWLADYPDYRDLTSEHEEIKSMVEKIGMKDVVNLNLPQTKDLRRWCSPIENQGSLGSCTANAGVGLLEYYEKKAFGRHIDGSRLFLYKTTRNLLRWTGDRGAYLRTTMAAMRLFGVPPKKYWPYVTTDFDKEPSSFCYSLAQNYQAIRYFRLDYNGITRTHLLEKIKMYIAHGLPSMFGFTVYNSISDARRTGKIPYPSRGDRRSGGHAIVAVGYDDHMEIRSRDGSVTTGALLIRNSWGTGWGENGYGWLPYKYVLNGLAVDWWTLLKNEWVDTKQFGL